MLSENVFKFNFNGPLCGFSGNCDPYNTQVMSSTVTAMNGMIWE